MPPIKGRMMGLQSAGMSAGMSQFTSDDVKPGHADLGFKQRKPSFRGGRGGRMVKRAICEDELKKLRIPKEICKHLPSVKKFSHNREFVPMTTSDVKMEDENSQDSINMVLGARRGRGASNKYHIMAIAERKFTGIVWDLKFSQRSPELEILVSCGDGVFLCDSSLLILKQLENIRLAGGIGYLSDGQIISICRVMDVVNIYTPDGEFISGFTCSPSPMSLCITPDDELIIADCLKKEINTYQVDGTLISKIPSRGQGYNIRWPLYMDSTENGNFIVVDCHLQTVLMFDKNGHYLKTIPTRTYGANEVLRPHGLCVTPTQDMFLIDNAINTLEVFSLSGKYLQTLFPTEEGSKLQPKVVACSPDGEYMALGGLKGHVRLFKFVSSHEAKLDIKREIKQEFKDEKKMTPVTFKPRPKGKLELKRIKEELEGHFDSTKKFKTEINYDDDVRIEAVISKVDSKSVNKQRKSDGIKTVTKTEQTEIHRNEDGDEVTVIVLD